MHTVDMLSNSLLYIEQLSSLFIPTNITSEFGTPNVVVLKDI